MSPAPSITVRVPASTSNCGSGFDSLGLALRLYNRITLSRRADQRIQGVRPEDGRAQAMVEDAAQRFASFAGTPQLGFEYRIDGEVPSARGLGSSVTVLAGIVAALNACHDDPLTKHDLVELVTAIEGHPDNASAGVLGGFCVARCDAASGRYVDTVRIGVPDTLRFVVVSPANEIATKDSRGALPAQLPYFDAIKSVNSAVYLTAVFATGEFTKLRGAVADFFHEPYRLPRIPGARAAIDGGVAAGALTGWLSGSGSSVLCVVEQDQAEPVAMAMQAAFAAVGVHSVARMLAADNDGLVVERQ
jgi:homoserine kinase